jgi:plasmid maintenance system antidote protein VapI
MMLKKKNFRPDWVSPPGETIADLLEERGLSVAEFAEGLGRPPVYTSDLLHGREVITPEVARRLEALLHGSAAFWINRESQYREDLTRLQREAHNVAARAWLGELPLKDMIKFGWLERGLSASAAQAAACLRFFAVPDVDAWRRTYGQVLEVATFRTSPSFASQPGAVAAWLRQGEIESVPIDCRPWDGKRFEAQLTNLRRLTWRKNPNSFIPEVQKRCAECGVAVAIVRTPAGCRASGATRFISPTKALLLLSFRYLSDDHFWFTFFHEAGHLVLHDKKAIFLEGENRPQSKEEEEANAFAGRVLIPREFQAAFMSLRPEGREVIRFARRVGVAPGIVVGQLQYHERLKQHQLNSLKRRFRWSD